MSNLKIKCSCGKVEGLIKDVSPKKGNHIVCMCIDCQSFARILQKDQDILDKSGGTQIYQTSPSKIEITKGSEYLGVLRLSPKGTIRWYTTCCNSPIANTIGAGFDFAGVILHSTDYKTNKEVDLGPIKYHCMSKYSKNPPAIKSHQGFPKILTIKVMIKILMGKILKSDKPNPFFNENSGEICGPIKTLNKREREEIRSFLK